MAIGSAHWGQILPTPTRQVKTAVLAALAADEPVSAVGTFVDTSARKTLFVGER